MPRYGEDTTGTYHDIDVSSTYIYKKVKYQLQIIHNLLLAFEVSVYHMAINGCAFSDIPYMYVVECEPYKDQLIKLTGKELQFMRLY